MTAKTKGHWPKGKRRHADIGDWSRIRLSVQALLDDHPLRGVRSIRAIAAALDVDPKTVLNWMKGIDRPALRAWAKDQRERLRRPS